MSRSYTRSRKACRFEHQDGRCHYCKDPMTAEAATWDHLTPKSRGGTRNYGNLALACYGCNQAKGNLTEAEFSEAARVAGGYSRLWGRVLSWREGQGAFISGTFKLGEILGPLLGALTRDHPWSECGT